MNYSVKDKRGNTETQQDMVSEFVQSEQMSQLTKL